MKTSTLPRCTLLGLVLLGGTLSLFACSADGDSGASSGGSGASTGNAGTGGSDDSGGSSSTSGGASSSAGGADGGSTSGTGGISTGSGGSVSTGGTGDAIYTPGPPVTIDYTGGGSFFQGEDACDGVDNDGNGVVDDVDVGQDGICDCLKIATVGRMGIWGTGNVFTQWLNSRGAEAAADLGDQVLTDDLLAPYQVIVVLNLAMFTVRNKGVTYPEISHAYSTDEATAMENWIRAGGGLMGTIGYTSNETAEMTNINTLLAFSGMGYNSAATDTDGDVSNWLSHPTTSGMGVARMRNGSRPLTTAGSTIGWDGQDREALQVLEIDGGRIALWGDEWITYDSDWNNVSDLDIELFWLNLIKWLTPPMQCQVPIPPIVH